MYFLLSHILEILFGALALQLVVSAFLVFSNRRHIRETQRLEKELFGFVKRMEGLTAGNRERMRQQYDQMLLQLESRLPADVAAKAQQLIFDTESQILKRLAEIEPALQGDEEGMKKFDSLIVTMEQLEETVIATASNAVRDAVIANRAALNELDSDIAQ